jgi:spore germination cell wall hydrolase CwlJ-like protein
MTARRLNIAAIATVTGFALAFLGAGAIVVTHLNKDEVAVPAGAENLPALPASPDIPTNPIELAFGTDKPDWNMTDFDVEGTANNPSAYQNISKEEARVANEQLPFAAEKSPAAAPFFLNAQTPLDALKAQHCLSLAVYYEAKSESMQGQYAVAQVVLNRVRHPAWPHSVCGVVFQGSQRATGCQFTFTCDGALGRPPSGRAWQTAQGVAASALNGFVLPNVGHATHYHTDWVSPYWAPSLRKLVMVGTHIFYTWKGGGGNPSAFRVKYAGREAWPSKAAASAPQFGAADAVEIPTSTEQAQQEATAITPPIGGAVGSGAPIAASPNSSSATEIAAGSRDVPRVALFDARAESEAARMATGDPVPTRDRPTLPKIGPNGLMAEPDLNALLPKYNLPTEPLKKPTIVVPQVADQTPRRDQGGRAMDGF